MTNPPNLNEEPPQDVVTVTHADGTTDHIPIPAGHTQPRTVALDDETIHHLAAAITTAIADALNAGKTRWPR